MKTVEIHLEIINNKQSQTKCEKYGQVELFRGPLAILGKKFVPELSKYSQVVVESLYIVTKSIFQNMFPVVVLFNLNWLQR